MVVSIIFSSVFTLTSVIVPFLIASSINAFPSEDCSKSTLTYLVLTLLRDPVKASIPQPIIENPLRI